MKEKKGIIKGYTASAMHLIQLADLRKKDLDAIAERINMYQKPEDSYQENFKLNDSERKM